MQAELSPGEESGLSEWTWEGFSDPASMPVLSDGAAKLWIICVVWNACSIPAAMPYLRKGINPHDYGAWITLGFAVAGVVMIVLLIRSILVIRKYGSSRFRLDTLPAIVGGELRGTAHVPLAGLAPSSPVTLRLTCIRITTSQGTTEHTLWQEEQTTAALPAAGSSAMIPVAFAVPADARPCSKAFNETIEWRLEARCRTRGVNYQARFGVPVFSAAAAEEFAAAVRYKASAPPPEYHPVAPNWHSQFHEHGITYAPVAGNAWRIHFAPARNVSNAFWFSVIGLFATGIPILVMSTSLEEWPPLRPLILSGLAVVLVPGLLIDALAIYFWFVSTTVTVRRGSLVLEYRLLLFRVWRKTLELEQIADIVCQDGGSSTVGRRTHYVYSITLKATDGGDIDLGVSISQEDFARWLTDEIKNTLGFTGVRRAESQPGRSGV